MKKKYSVEKIKAFAERCGNSHFGIKNGVRVPEFYISKLSTAIENSHGLFNFSVEGFAPCEHNGARNVEMWLTLDACLSYMDMYNEAILMTESEYEEFCNETANRLRLLMSVSAMAGETDYLRVFNKAMKMAQHAPDDPSPDNIYRHPHYKPLPRPTQRLGEGHDD